MELLKGPRTLYHSSATTYWFLKFLKLLAQLKDLNGQNDLFFKTHLKIMKR